MTLSDYQQAKLDKETSRRNQIKEFLKQKTLDELSYIRGRYCGPSNSFLSEKEFGYHMPTDLVDEEIAMRSFEDHFLGNE